MKVLIQIASISLNRDLYNESVLETAVGMFGIGAGWTIPVTNRTLKITPRDITEKPTFVAGQIENHEYLCVTLRFDHDIVDGAPPARSIQRLKELLESS